jgi:hypothetical protein
MTVGDYLSDLGEDTYYMAVNSRWFHDSNARLHVVQGASTTKTLCGIKVFGAYETCVEEDKDDSRLCIKCRERMNWAAVAGEPKVYLDTL